MTWEMTGISKILITCSPSLDRQLSMRWQSIWPAAGAGIGIRSFAAVVVVSNVQRALIRAERDPVRLFDIVRNFNDGRVFVEAIDRAMLEFPRFITHVTRIGEIDATVRVDTQVIGSIEAIPVKAIDDRLAPFGKMGSSSVPSARRNAGTIHVQTNRANVKLSQRISDSDERTYTCQSRCLISAPVAA
jgi:hypothetical protein